ncbi:MAG: glycosyltransferase [Anaerolineae bacterium]|nr:glycosyltransferase [Anaerolineae bacterium]
MSEEHPQPRVAWVKLAFRPPTEAFIADQLKLLRRYDPLVLTLDAPEAIDLPPEAVWSLERANPVTRGLNRLTLKVSHSAPFFVGQVRRERCRLVHAQSGLEGSYAMALASRLRLPLVTTFRDGDASRAAQRQRRAYERLFSQGQLFLADARAVRRDLLDLGCPEDRLRVHHPGIDLERIPFSVRRPERRGPVNVLVVGRMVQRKGICYALQAFASVRRYQRRLSLTLIGDGPERPAIGALLRELDLPDVRVLGWQSRDGVLAEMQRAHIYLQPSVTAPDGDVEGIPMALVEAQASGLPVVATWHSGIPELVVDGRSGYLVSERDAHGLAERLRHLVEHPELWGPFGRAARAAVEDGFSARKQAEVLESYYDGLLSGE